jgi:DNA polymerase-3 subunit delta
MSRTEQPQTGSSAAKPLLKLYLFNGEDTLKQKTLLERLKERVAELGDLTMNFQLLAAKELRQPAPLLDALNTLPFGSPKRLVVVREAEALSKPLQEALISYINRPSDTTVLVLVAKKLPANGRLYKAISAYDRQAIIDCSPKKRSELPALIRGLAQKEGIDITTSAANLLIERVGTSTGSLNTEIGKLAAIVKAAGTGRIEDEDVVRNVVCLVEPKLWDLANALALRDAALCLRLVERMHGYTAVGLFAQCVTRLREILTAITLKKRGLPVASSMGKQDWQLREVIRATGLYRAEELEALLKKAPQIERQMKTGADANQLLRLWLIDVCTRKPLSVR